MASPIITHCKVGGTPSRNAITNTPDYYFPHPHTKEINLHKTYVEMHFMFILLIILCICYTVPTRSNLALPILQQNNHIHNPAMYDVLTHLRFSETVLALL